MLLAAGAVSCTSVQVDNIDVAALHPDYFFYVTFDARGTPARLSPIYGVEGTKIVFGGDPLFQISEGEASAVAVAMTKAELLLLHGGFLAGEAERMTVELAQPPSEPITFDDHAIAPLPKTVRVLGSSAAAIDRTITLSIPVEPEWCKSKSERSAALHAFGSMGELMPADFTLADGTFASGDTYRRLVRVFKLDDDRVLAASERLMFVLRRGEPFGRHVLQFEAADPRGLRLLSMAIGPADANGRRAILGAGELDNHPGVFDFELDGDDVRFVRTATSALASEFTHKFMLDALIDEAGNSIAIGDGGVAFFRRHGESTFELRKPISNPGIAYEYRRVIDARDGVHRHLLAEGDGRLMLGDMDTNVWEIFERSDRFDNRRFYSLAAAPDGEHWAVGVRGSILAKRTGENWKVVDLYLPPSFEACANTTPEGRRALTSTLRAVSIDQDATYLAFSDCNVMLRVTRAERCVSVLAPENVHAMPTHLDWLATDIAGGELIVGGSNGLLYSVPVNAP